MDIYRSAATDNRNGSKVFSLIREKFFWSSSFLAMELFDGGPKGNWTVALDEMMRYSIGFWWAHFTVLCIITLGSIHGMSLGVHHLLVLEFEQDFIKTKLLVAWALTFRNGLKCEIVWWRRDSRNQLIVSVLPIFFSRVKMIMMALGRNLGLQHPKARNNTTTLTE